MIKSRAELSPLLSLFEQMMPGLIEKHTVDTDFSAAVVEHANAIKADCDPADHRWLNAQICHVLDDFGKRHDDYLPLPDDLSG